MAQVRTGCITCNSSDSDDAPSFRPNLTMVPKREDFDSRALEYFHVKTLPAVSGFIGTDLWSRLLLQLCETESSIKSAVSALSSFHELAETQGFDRVAECDSGKDANALQHYNRAIQQLCSRLEYRPSSKTLTLACCIIFTCLEFIRGERESALGHLKSGLSILRRLPEDDENVAREDVVESCLAPAFSRMSLIQTIYGQPREARYMDLLFCNMPEAPFEFTDLDTARNAAIQLTNITMDLAYRIDFGQFASAVDATASQIAVVKSIEQWEHAFTPMLDCKDVDQRAAQLLRSIVILDRIWISRCLQSREECAFDIYTEDFHELIQSMETVVGEDLEARVMPSFTIDTGMISTLFFTSVKCRNRYLRRRAVELIRKCPRKEGLFDSVEMSMVSEFIIETEERGMPPLPCDELPVEESRVSDFRFVVLEKGLPHKLDVCLYHGLSTVPDTLVAQRTIVYGDGYGTSKGPESVQSSDTLDFVVHFEREQKVLIARRLLKLAVEDEGETAVEVRDSNLVHLRELGPPDLVHLTKQSHKSSLKQPWIARHEQVAYVARKTGVYHHVTGVDASSSASLAACYNAFSRLDMRVTVAIPGSVESYCIDEKGDKKEASDALWLETYLCSVLRAYSYADDGGGDAVKKIVGCRRFNPITSTELEHKFLDAAERLFWQGWQLGSDPEIQVPNLVSNHLTSGLLNYIKTAGRFTSGINLFEKLRSRDPEVSSLLAQVYIAADEEVKAVRLLHEAIQELPMDYALLDTQAQFCKSKGRFDLALEIARRSVIAAPSEFGTWARLVEIYIGLEQWDLALLTLNSCPMFTYQDRDVPPTPRTRINLPIMPETQCDDIDDGGPSDPDAVHPQLRKLVGATFRGTFQKAYSLLTEITKRIGWDALLKVRSQVFVMEEEYRTERQGVSRTTSTTHVNGNAAMNAPTSGVTSAASSENGASPNASTVALNGDAPAVAKPSHTVTTSSEPVPADGEAPPDPTSPNPEVTVTDSSPAVNTIDPSHSSYSNFRHKRLCERWLDNLFMVLYEDLRLFTIWRSDLSQARAQQQSYRRNPEEWELLAQLAQRLHYEAEAREACQACLSLRFSPKAMTGVMDSWEREGQTRNIIGAVARLVCWQYRWYSEVSQLFHFAARYLVRKDESKSAKAKFWVFMS
ncbi:MAG: hypothetical protein Q9159_007683 [Coniocarpon cinnabarinum]